jgi:hypothetical protein
MKTIDRLPFPYEYLGRVRKVRKEHGSEEFVAVVSDECEREIESLFCSKLRAAAETGSIEDSYPNWRRNFYLFWGRCDPQGLGEYLRGRLQDHPEDANKILSAILQFDEESTRHVPNQHGNEEYGFLINLISPSKWMRAINTIYPDPELQMFQMQFIGLLIYTPITLSTEL